MKKSYYDKKKDAYIDVTTGNEYHPKGYCELCGSSYLLAVHHYLNQRKCIEDMKTKLKYPKTYTKEFIQENQKLFTLCIQCHSDVEHLSNKRFFEKYGIERKEFINLKEE